MRAAKQKEQKRGIEERKKEVTRKGMIDSGQK